MSVTQPVLTDKQKLDLVSQAIDGRRVGYLDPESFLDIVVAVMADSNPYADDVEPAS